MKTLKIYFIGGGIMVMLTRQSDKTCGKLQYASNRDTSVADFIKNGIVADFSRDMDGDTAMPKTLEVIKYLKDIQPILGFEKVLVTGSYIWSSEEITEALKAPIKEKV